MALMTADPAPLLDALVIDERGMTVDPARLHEVFYGDSEPSVVERIAPLLRSMPVGDAWQMTGPA
jgi:hypothetical protein